MRTRAFDFKYGTKLGGAFQKIPTEIIDQYYNS